MKKLAYILGMFVIFATFAYGQGITMTIGSRTASVGDTITVPVSVTNFNNIGAVSLKIQFTSSVLTFLDVENQPATGNFTDNASNGVLTVGWFSTTPLNLGNGKLLDMKFIYNGGTSNIDFVKSQCEVANISGNPLVVDYYNGIVSPVAVTKLILPQITAVAGDNISVPLDFENLNNVGAISLKINYDPSVLTYTGVSDQPSAGTFTVNAAGGVVSLGWFDTTPLNIGNGTFVKLNFAFKGGTSDLNFITAQCEVSNPLGNPIFTEYENGRVTFDLSLVPKFTIENLVAIPGSNVSIPLDIKNLANAGAISLKINYDPTVLTYTGVSNGPTTGNFTANASNGVISIGWFDTTPMNIDSGKFLDLNFTYIGGMSSISFSEWQCEVSDALGNPLFVYYTNGTIIPNVDAVPVLDIAKVHAVAGNSVVVPLVVNNFQNVGAVSLKIEYDPAIVSFTGASNQPAAGNFTVNASGGVITLGWFDTTPYGLDSVKFVDLNFNYIGGTSDLAFDLGQCEISNNVGQPLFSLYNNGKVEPLSGTVPTVMLPNMFADPGSNISVPLTVNNFNNVGAISLKIQYDPTVLTYTGISNQPTTGNFTSNVSGGVITIGWFDTTPFGKDSVKFLDLNFSYIGGNSDLIFKTSQSEISDAVGTPLYVEYINGSVSLNEGSYPIFRLGNVATSVGETISLPLVGMNLTDIGAISLKVQYSPANLTYVGVENQPTAGNFTSNSSGGVITLGWFNTTAMNIDSGKFLDLRFIYNGGTSSVNFLTAQCEVAKINGEVINYVMYINGSVAGNQPPVFVTVMPDTVEVEEGTPYSFEYKAQDPNLDTKLLYSIVQGPKTAKFDSVSGKFSWTPGYSESGIYPVQVEVTDGVLSTLTDTSYIVVLNVNFAPVFTESIHDSALHANQTYVFKNKATDPNGDVVTYELVSSTFVGATISPTLGDLTLVLSRLDEGKNYTIVVRATDGSLYTDVTATYAIGLPDGVPEEPGIPTEFSLKQNYPNPFNPTTKIRYGIPEESKVTIRVFNLLGQQLAVLVNEVKPAGYYSVNFDASNLTSGIYLYKIEAKNFNSVRKMVLVK